MKKAVLIVTGLMVTLFLYACASNQYAVPDSVPLSYEQITRSVESEPITEPTDTTVVTQPLSETVSEAVVSDTEPTVDAESNAPYETETECPADESPTFTFAIQDLVLHHSIRTNLEIWEFAVTVTTKCVSGYYEWSFSGDQTWVDFSDPEGNGFGGVVTLILPDGNEMPIRGIILNCAIPEPYILEEGDESSQRWHLLLTFSFDHPEEGIFNNSSDDPVPPEWDWTSPGPYSIRVRFQGSETVFENVFFTEAGN